MPRANEPLPHPGSEWTAAAVAAALVLDRGDAADAASIPAPNDWGAVVEAVAQHRVIAVVAPWVDRLGVPDRVRPQFRSLLTRHLRRGLALQHDTAAVSTLLTDAGVDHLIVKGIALAAIVGDDPAGRGGGDIDVWARRADLNRVAAVLAGEGWSPRNHDFQRALETPGWRQQALDRLTCEVGFDHPTRASVDLHWRLTPSVGEWPLGFDEAASRAVSLDIAGTTIRTLCPPDAFVHVAHHGRKEGWPAIRQLVDLVRVFELCDEAEVRALAAADPDVAVALAVAQGVDPRCADIWPRTGRTERLAGRGWAGCLSLRAGDRAIARLTGRERLMAVQRRRLWKFRSAARWRTRGHVVANLLFPPGILLQPSPPPLSLLRHVIGKLRVITADPGS